MSDPKVKPSSEMSHPIDLEAGQFDNEIIRAIEEKSLFYYKEKKSSLVARYVYGIIFLITNLCAWFIRDYAQTALALIPCNY